MIVRCCTVGELIGDPNLATLLLEYAEESALAGLPPPKPHFASYEALETTGMLQAIGAFSNDTLIGFAILLAVVLPHYSVIVASTESFFVGRAHRKTGAGRELLQAVETEARKREATGLLVSAPLGGKLAEVLSRQRSYREVNRVFLKALA